ncbi:unnamed protein product [Vitrella brassicaformis CCMP3155]|uniref:Uncharacterized protein n=2 Tax=Vitrella brassicaformis TaxID=1169539 RepID=A0A0G4F6J3_VITBC|nr:unnamed protein product [Vitrella brassicaformis CCMP3155]|eukprot:CEM07647.1 unnamed protein product [Vitrella brassicaformis CCMP3155]
MIAETDLVEMPNPVCSSRDGPFCPPLASSATHPPHAVLSSPRHHAGGLLSQPDSPAHDWMEMPKPHQTVATKGNDVAMAMSRPEGSLTSFFDYFTLVSKRVFAGQRDVLPDADVLTKRLADEERMRLYERYPRLRQDDDNEDTEGDEDDEMDFWSDEDDGDEGATYVRHYDLPSLFLKDRNLASQIIRKERITGEVDSLASIRHEMEERPLNRKVVTGPGQRGSNYTSGLLTFTRVPFLSHNVPPGYCHGLPGTIRCHWDGAWGVRPPPFLGKDVTTLRLYLITDVPRLDLITDRPHLNTTAQVMSSFASVRFSHPIVLQRLWLFRYPSASLSSHPYPRPLKHLKTPLRKIDAMIKQQPQRPHHQAVHGTAATHEAIPETPLREGSHGLSNGGNCEVWGRLGPRRSVWGVGMDDSDWHVVRETWLTVEPPSALVREVIFCGCEGLYVGGLVVSSNVPNTPVNSSAKTDTSPSFVSQTNSASLVGLSAGLPVDDDSVYAIPSMSPTEGGESVMVVRRSPTGFRLHAMEAIREVGMISVDEALVANLVFRNLTQYEITQHESGSDGQVVSSIPLRALIVAIQQLVQMALIEHTYSLPIGIQHIPFLTEIRRIVTLAKKELEWNSTSTSPLIHTILSFHHDASRPSPFAPIPRTSHSGRLEEVHAVLRRLKHLWRDHLGSKVNMIDLGVMDRVYTAICDWLSVMSADSSPAITMANVMRREGGAGRHGKWRCSEGRRHDVMQALTEVRVLLEGGKKILLKTPHCTYDDTVTAALGPAVEEREPTHFSLSPPFQPPPLTLDLLWSDLWNASRPMIEDLVDLAEPSLRDEPHLIEHTRHGNHTRTPTARQQWRKLQDARVERAQSVMENITAWLNGKEIGGHGYDVHMVVVCIDWLERLFAGEPVSELLPLLPSLPPQPRPRPPRVFSSAKEKKVPRVDGLDGLDFFGVDFDVILGDEGVDEDDELSEEEDEYEEVEDEDFEEEGQDEKEGLIRRETDLVGRINSIMHQLSSVSEALMRGEAAHQGRRQELAALLRRLNTLTQSLERLHGRDTMSSGDEDLSRRQWQAHEDLFKAADVVDHLVSLVNRYADVVDHSTKSEERAAAVRPHAEERKKEREREREREGGGRQQQQQQQQQRRHHHAVVMQLPEEAREAFEEIIQGFADVSSSSPEAPKSKRGASYPFQPPTATTSTTTVTSSSNSGPSGSRGDTQKETPPPLLPHRRKDKGEKRSMVEQLADRDAGEREGERERADEGVFIDIDDLLTLLFQQ